MLLRERRNGEVAMIMPLVVPNRQLPIHPRLLCRGREVLRQELTLLVEVVVCALHSEDGRSATGRQVSF